MSLRNNAYFFFEYENTYQLEYGDESGEIFCLSKYRLFHNAASTFLKQSFREKIMEGHLEEY